MRNHSNLDVTPNMWIDEFEHSSCFCSKTIPTKPVLYNILYLVCKRICCPYALRIVVCRYDSLAIHYQFHESQNDPATDPLATWHNGGPGSSSIDLGLYTEMGYFQTDDEGEHTNPYAWNQVASMLYLESPAGYGPLPLCLLIFLFFFFYSSF